MASLAATNWPKPLVLVPCLSWSTASSVFTQGVMSQSINWDRLETQFFADGNYCERLAKMVTVVDESFVAGQQFMKQFKRSLKELKSDINETKYQFDNPKTNIIHMSDQEKLTSKLVNQLMSKDATEFTTIEINYINEKIKEIQNRMDDEKRLEDEKKLEENKIKSTESTLETASNVITTATNGITSALFAGKTQLMSLILPTPKDQSSSSVIEKIPEKPEKIDITKTNWWEREALQFMRGVMDECTHLKNFSVPLDTSLIIVVCAKDDAYVPRDGCSSLDELWPGAEIRYLDAGHVSAYVLHQKLFRSCIVEAFERSKKKWIECKRETIGDNATITQFKLTDNNSNPNNSNSPNEMQT